MEMQREFWQTVYLESRPSNHIKNLFFTPDIDKSEVGVKVILNKQTQTKVPFKINGSGINFQTEIEAGVDNAEFTIPIRNQKLWTLEDPYLYEVETTFGAEDTEDKVSSYFGMRKISAVQIPGKDYQYVALNNQPVYLRLALDQSYHPDGFYTFPSDKFMKEEIQRAKDLGLNGLRIHIKAEMPRKLYWGR